MSTIILFKHYSMAQIEGGDRAIIDPLFLCTPNCKQDLMICAKINANIKNFTISNTNFTIQSNKKAQYTNL